MAVSTKFITNAVILISRVTQIWNTGGKETEKQNLDVNYELGYTYARNSPYKKTNLVTYKNLPVIPKVVN